METPPPADLLPSSILRYLFLLLSFLVILWLCYDLSLDYTIHIYGEVYRWFRKTVQHKFGMMINKEDFLLFNKLSISWSQDPSERDARYIREALLATPISKNIIMEIACTRSSYALAAIKTAYHSLFKTTLDHDLARYITGTEIEHKLLTALMHGYRNEGREVDEELAKHEALTLFHFLADAEAPPMDDRVVMILASRSLLHIKSLLRQYQETIGNSFYDELGTTHPYLKDMLQCLCSPSAYFCKVIEEGMVAGETNEGKKEDLGRVIVTRADVDMKKIKVEFYRRNGITLSQRIARERKGDYIDFLLMLIAREEETTKTKTYTHRLV